MRLIFFLILLIVSCDIQEGNFFPSKPGLKWIYSIIVESSYTGKSFEKRIMILNANENRKGNVIEVSKLYSDGSYYTYEINRKQKKVTRKSVVLTFDEGIVEPVQKVIYPDINFNVKEWIVREQLFLVRGFQPPLLNVKPTSQFDMKYKIKKKHKIFRMSGKVYKNCVEIEGQGKTDFIADTRSGPIDVKIKNNEVICDGIGVIMQERFENTDASAFGNMKLKKELINFN